MQIVKPKRLGLINKTYQLGEHHFAVGALAFFPLGSEPVLLEEYQQWSRCYKQLPDNTVLDMGFAKPRGEVLISSRAFRPGGSPLRGAQPGFELGKLHKRVALGPADIDAAPVASLGPLDVNHPQRSCYNGTYDKQWLQQVHPGLPEDTDARLFNAAAPDQQLKRGFFLPGTAYTLYDMHPEKPQVCGKLPDITVRIFTTTAAAGEAGLAELETRLETVWFFPEIDLGVALYRAVAMVGDSDGLDVKQLMLAAERSTDTPRNLDYYREVLALRTNPETAVAHLFNESQLLPVKTEQEAAALEQLYEDARSARKQRHAAQAASLSERARQTSGEAVPESISGLETVSDSKSESTVEPPVSKEQSMEIPVIPQALVEAGDFDLTPLIAHSADLQKQLEAQAETKRSEMEELAQTYATKYPAAAVDPARETKEVLARLGEPVYVHATDLESPGSEAAGNRDLSSLLGHLPPATQAMLKNNNAVNTPELQDAAGKMAVLQRQARQSAPELMAARKLSDTARIEARSWLDELLAAGGSVAGRDLAGLDLSGMDLSAMDLRDVMFEECDLRGCNFRGSSMEGAVLVDAFVEGAQFDGASLAGANLCKCHGESASFRQVTFTDTLLQGAVLISCDFSAAEFIHVMAQEADLRHSCFDNVKVSDSILTQAKLDGSCWRDAGLQGCIFMQVSMCAADWSRADLNRCMFVDVSGSEARFTGANLDTVQFSNVGELRASDFSRAICKVCGFRGVDLAGIGATGAIFIECDFADSLLVAGVFTQALFKACMLMQADFSDSICEEAIFNESNLKKARFERVDLQRAEFHNSTLIEVQFIRCKTRGMRRHPVASAA
jgi:uncharacterized protein YjbI with pentapeptide repeats